MLIGIRNEEGDEVTRCYTGAFKREDARTQWPQQESILLHTICYIPSPQWISVPRLSVFIRMAQTRPRHIF